MDDYRIKNQWMKGFIKYNINKTFAINCITIMLYHSLKFK